MTDRVRDAGEPSLRQRAIKGTRSAICKIAPIECYHGLYFQAIINPDAVKLSPWSRALDRPELGKQFDLVE